MEKIIEWNIPVKTVSESNMLSEHWRKKYIRHKVQKNWICACFKMNKTKIPLPCTVKMTRIAKRKLDEDENLRMAFKWIKDYIADQLIPGLAPGRADDSKQIKWEYDQISGEVKEFSIRIEIFI